MTKTYTYYRRHESGEVTEDTFDKTHHPFFEHAEQYSHSLLRGAMLECVNKWNRQSQGNFYYWIT